MEKGKHSMLITVTDTIRRRERSAKEFHLTTATLPIIRLPNTNFQCMNVSPSKENILKKVRKALSNSTPIPFPKSEGKNSIYHPLQQDLEIEFAQQFTKLQGKFIYCLNRKELGAQLNGLIQNYSWTKIFCCEEKLAR